MNASLIHKSTAEEECSEEIKVIHYLINSLSEKYLLDFCLTIVSKHVFYYFISK